MNPPRDFAGAAAWLGKSESWLRKQVALGLVPHSKVGRDVRFTDEHLEEIVLDGEVRPKAPLRKKDSGRKTSATRKATAPANR